MEKALNKLVGIIGVILLILIACLAAYGIFLTLTEYSPEEVTTLEVQNNSSQVISIESPLTAVTYNLGFGAYTHDFDFLLDGGKNSAIKDNNIIVDNITESINTLLSINPDFILLQEVDQDSTRSRYINQYQMITRIFADYGSTFSSDFNVKWIPYPFTHAIGKIHSGQATLSNKSIDNATRITLPSDQSWPRRLLNTDPGLLVTRMPTSDDKELVLVNIHLPLDKHDKEDAFIKGQLSALEELITTEYEKENYIIVGGDFNHLLPVDEEVSFRYTDEIPSWINPLPVSFSPDNFSWALDMSSPTMRDPSLPFKKGSSFVGIVDGFLVSDNVRILESKTLDNNFKNSDHHPTYIKFELKPKRKRMIMTES